MRLEILTLFSLLWAVPVAFADVATDPSIAAVSAIVPNAVTNRDLTSNTWTLHPTAGYFTGTVRPDSTGATSTVSGEGGTMEFQYALSDHFGVNFSVLGYKGSGNYNSGTVGVSPGDVTVNGWLAGAQLVFDAFSGNGFRLPFFIGGDYQHLYSSSPTSTKNTKVTLDAPGLMLGVSPRFNFWFTRVEPFLVASVPMAFGQIDCTLSSPGDSCDPAGPPVLPVFGVNLVFQKPIPFSFYFNLSTYLAGSGVAFYSLGPHFSF